MVLEAGRAWPFLRVAWVPQARATDALQETLSMLRRQHDPADLERGVLAPHMPLDGRALALPLLQSPSPAATDQALPGGGPETCLSRAALAHPNSAAPFPAAAAIAR